MLFLHQNKPQWPLNISLKRPHKPRFQCSWVLATCWFTTKKKIHSIHTRPQVVIDHYSLNLRVIKEALNWLISKSKFGTGKWKEVEGRGWGGGHRAICNVAVHVCHSRTDKTELPPGRKTASLNFYICVRFLSYHLSARFWVQPPRPRLLLRPHRLHFPAHLRYCWCVCFSFPCCSSGWAFYRIRVSLLFSTSISGCCQRCLTFLWTPFLQRVCSVFSACCCLWRPRGRHAGFWCGSDSSSFKE